MTPLGLVRVAAARAVVDVPEDVLRPFTFAFADRIAGGVAVEVPTRLDGLTVRVRLAEATELLRVGPVLEEAGLSFEGLDQLIDGAVAALGENRRVELAVEVRKDEGWSASYLRIYGGTSFFDLSAQLEGSGVAGRARQRWDDLSASLLVREAAFLDLGFDQDGLLVRVWIDRHVPTGEIARWTGQLDHVLERIGIPAAQRAWMRALHPSLCTRKVNNFLWGLQVREERVPPWFCLVLPRVPASLVLKHAVDQHPEVEHLGLRFGGLLGALNGDNDDVARWGIELGEAGPRTWLEA